MAAINLIKVPNSIRRNVAIRHLSRTSPIHKLTLDEMAVFITYAIKMNCLILELLAADTL